MNKKRLKKLANQILKFEEIAKGDMEARSEAEKQILKITNNLTLDEMFELDEYIMSNRLTK